MLDTIVVGLGAMGSSAACQLAERGNRVLGLEQFSAVHDKGSSHGASRMIRQAYFEHPAYVPLLMRAYELWRRLEHDTDANILNVTGGLMIGPPNSEVVSGSIRSAKEHNLPHEVLSADKIRRRFPPTTPAPNEIALYELNAGYVRPEESIRQYLNLAAKNGADLHFEEPVQSWAVSSTGHVTVKTAVSTYEAERMILCSGAWAPTVLADLGLPLTVTRQVMFWFNPIGGIDQFLPDRWPVYIWEAENSPRPFYGFPSIDGRNGGVKAAIHSSDVTCDPAALDRQVAEREILAMRGCLSTRIPSLNGAMIKAETCMYTMTPDGHFVIASHPEYACVTIAAGFSGHGFKFASVVGEILADLTTTGATRHNIKLFSPLRFKRACG